MIRNAVGTIQLKITNMCTIKAKCTNDNNLRTFMKNMSKIALWMHAKLQKEQVFNMFGATHKASI